MKAFFILILFLLVFILFAAKGMETLDLTPDSLAAAPAAAQEVVPMAVATSSQPQAMPIQPAATTTSLSAGLLLVTGGGGCSNPYTVQSGDTLSKIAVKCNTTLAALWQANPQITNSNLINPGQQIYIPDGSSAPIPVTGKAVAAPITALPQTCACDTAGVPVSGLKAGSMLQVKAHNFPPNEPVNIAIGRLTGGYTVVASGVTDATGTLNTQIVVPYATDSLTPWVVLVLTTSPSSIQVMTQPFTIDP